MQESYLLPFQKTSLAVSVSTSAVGEPVPAGEPRGGPQLLRVRAALANGAWWTLAALAAVTGDPEQAVSARIRDCRKPHLLGLTVEKRRRWGARQWEYRLPPGGTA